MKRAVVELSSSSEDDDNKAVIESKPSDAVTKPETATKSLVTTPTKCVRKNKAVTVATAMNGLVGALNQATSCLANAQSATPSQYQPFSSTTTQTTLTYQTTITPGFLDRIVLVGTRNIARCESRTRQVSFIVFKQRFIQLFMSSDEFTLVSNENTNNNTNLDSTSSSGEPPGELALYQLAESSPGKPVQYQLSRSSPGELVQYQLARSSPGELVQYQLARSSPGKLVQYQLAGGSPGELVHYQLVGRASWRAGTIPAGRDSQAPDELALYQLAGRDPAMVLNLHWHTHGYLPHTTGILGSCL
ncbi:hypothetical protein PCANC_22225 [Puccinia coronata f. sp. avenae]|uniref:Uncharacterized protein n=1 Tax=Puccinia coronata f. sp. avenae TaxID=200324 RepID=A0A2N5SCK0_9BASI|nr:hypothetical protein PCANC_22225 [Puccinia coronata f. sp. avenae]